jgi:hypothetical protein
MAITKILTNTIVGLGVAEVTAGTYLAPTVADVKIYDAENIAVDQGAVRIGNLASGNFQKGKYLSGVKTATTNIKMALQSSGTPTVAPAIKKFLECAGGTEYTDTNIGYRWAGAPVCETISYKDEAYDCNTEGVVEAMRGAVGVMTISAANVGAPIVIGLALTGLAVAEVDRAAGAVIVPSGFDTADCEKLLGVTTTINGTVYAVQSFSVATGAVASILMDGGNAEGGTQAALTDGDGVLTITLRDTGVTLQPFYADQVADNIYAAMTMEFANWDFSFANSQVLTQTKSDGNGFGMRELTIPFETFEMIQK